MRMSGISIKENPHHLDHIAPMCSILEIPLLLSHESMACLVRRYYPKVQVNLESGWDKFRKESLANDYDCLVYTNFYGVKEEIDSLRDPKLRPFRSVYCPHGNSDKGYFSVWMEQFACEDICLLYGQQMQDFLENRGVLGLLKQYQTIGNYRYGYYLKFQQFYDELVEKEIMRKFTTQKPVALYAPTWKDLEESTSFPEACKYIVDSVTPNYNLLIKFHPCLERQGEVAYVAYWREQIKERGDIQCVTDFCPIYPLLKQVDLFLGDVSSVGYDYLFFDRPMLIFNPNGREWGEAKTLFSCSQEVRQEDYGNLKELIAAEVARYRPERRLLYEYAYGATIPESSKIKNDILSCIENSL